MKSFLVLLISFYQKTFSLFFGGRCRFYPSCSQYAKEAIEKKGSLAGIMLSLNRVLRCHPWHPGGFDPVPVATSKNSHS